MKKKAKRKAKVDAPKISINLIGNIDPQQLTKYFQEQVNNAYCRETPFFAIIPKLIYLGQIDWIFWGEMKMLPPPRNYAREADEAIGKGLHKLADIFFKVPTERWEDD